MKIRKLVVITRCQDCPDLAMCAVGALVGDIPDECPLPDAPTATVCTMCGNPIMEWDAKSSHEIKICSACRLERSADTFAQMVKDLGDIINIMGGKDE